VIVKIGSPAYGSKIFRYLNENMVYLQAFLDTKTRGGACPRRTSKGTMLLYLDDV
jgi:hypothetical protein